MWDTHIGAGVGDFLLCSCEKNDEIQFGFNYAAITLRSFGSKSLRSEYLEPPTTYHSESVLVLCEESHGVPVEVSEEAQDSLIMGRHGRHSPVK